jgi:hypothetical protein
MKAEKGKKVDRAQITYNNLCSELDLWYKYINENKGDKKDTCQSALILTKNLHICCSPKGESKKTRDQGQEN